MPNFIGLVRLRINLAGRRRPPCRTQSHLYAASYPTSFRFLSTAWRRSPKILRRWEFVRLSRGPHGNGNRRTGRSAHRRDRRPHLALERVEDRTLMAYGLGLNFTGDRLADLPGLNAGFGYIPPDTMGAIGPNHFVEMTNGTFSVRNKT